MAGQPSLPQPSFHQPTFHQPAATYNPADDGLDALQDSLVASEDNHAWHDLAYCNRQQE